MVLLLGLSLYLAVATARLCGALRRKKPPTLLPRPSREPPVLERVLHEMEELQRELDEIEEQEAAQERLPGVGAAVTPAGPLPGLSAAEEEQQLFESVEASELAAAGQLYDRLRHSEDLPDGSERFLRPLTCLRFLRARKGDVDKAERMLRACLEWRRDCFGGAGVEPTTADWLAGVPAGAAAVSRRYWYGGFHGADRTGRPVNYVRFGTGDPAGITKAAQHHSKSLRHGEPGARAEPADALLTAAVTLCESLQTFEPVLAARRPGCLAGGGGYIEVVDMAADGVPNWGGRAFRAARHFAGVAKVVDANYPERLRKVFIIRTPRLFSAVWGLVRPLVDAGTQAKISIYPDNDPATGDRPPWLVRVSPASPCRSMLMLPGWVMSRRRWRSSSRRIRSRASSAGR